MTAALRHELEHNQHEFEFVEAAIPCPIAASLEALVSTSQTFYGHYNPRDLSTLNTAID